MLVSHIVLAGGLPPKGALEAIKETGAKVICFAPALTLAKKFIRSGVDALVIEGSEAGGHIGPVATSVLAQEILPEVCEQVPVFVAGGIGKGGMIASYLEMGAAGVQLGTRFACATESIAHPDFKKAFFRANARDAIASVQIDPRLPVIPVRALKNKGTEEFTAKQIQVAGMLDRGEVDMAAAQLEIEHFWAGALRRAVIDGDVGKRLDHGRAIGRDGRQGRAGRGDHRDFGRRSGRSAGAVTRPTNTVLHPQHGLRIYHHMDEPEPLTPLDPRICRRHADQQCDFRSLSADWCIGA